MLTKARSLIFLQDKESLQWSIRFGATLITILLLGLTITARDFYERERAYQTLAHQKLLWMSSEQARIENLRASAERTGNVSGESLISIVTTTAEKYGIVLSRYRPDGDFAVQLSTDNSPLRATLEWITSLQNEHHLSVLSMSLGRGNKNGLCKLHIELRSARFEQG